MNALEACAAALVVANVALVARRSMWNYPVALLAVAIYGYVFAGARLYSDAVLQAFFFAANVYGWRNWAISRAGEGEVVVERLAAPARLAWAGAGVAIWAGWASLMHLYTDAAYPWWDAALAIASVVAQLLQARRAIESWWLWIAIDVGSVPLYLAKGLWVTAALYGVLLAIAVAGLLEWHRALYGRQKVAIA
ncbi:nicotinamide riboside transporter PnuC [Sphingomonas beigongshangi]|uniref:nicotinamide riboside transporter PnuC n=1 Tax=Sphingomonas beigongshangi TaxID=2782540 RepID=UPI00193BC865